MIEPLASQLSGYFHFFGLKVPADAARPLPRARVAFDQAIALANTAARPPHARTSTG
jgi:RNA polymerase sigma-70 factor (ECF subfamily)